MTIDAVTASGAGGSGLAVYSAVNSKLQIGNFSLASFKISVMNQEHVNTGLMQLGVTDIVHGVIGADLLERANAVIDYSEKHLYLKAAGAQFSS